MLLRPIAFSMPPLRLTLAAAILGLSSACAHIDAPAPDDFEAGAEALAADWVRLRPEWATSMQYFEGAEQDALDREFRPRTEAQRELARALARRGLTQLAGWRAGPLTPDQQAAAATLRWSLQRSLDAAPFEDHSFAFNQQYGLQVSSINFLTRTHPMRRSADVQSYLARLAQLPDRFDEAITGARAAADRGLLPPRFMVERVRTQVDDFLKPSPADNLLVTSLDARIAELKDLPAAQRQAALLQASRVVAERVRPAFERLRALLDELHMRTNDDAGLWRLPDGAAAYAQALAANTTTSMTADQIHTIGLREVARIEAEMDRILRAMGRTTGSVNQRVAQLNAELQPPAEPDPRPKLLARYAELVREAEQRSAPLFNLKPQAPVEVRRVSALTERSASASYTTPAPDGSRPGIFWVPLPGPRFNLLGMKTLAIHEGVPGHHFQLALLQEQADLPRWRQRRVFSGGSAHSEGWALYAERLAIEQGWYGGDPTSLLGAWNAQLFRARRLVVDTGLHAKRWTREQAIAYGISASEVERYVANPGQACAYMVGMLHIVALRDEAMAALGPKFSLPAFHDVVLGTGSVPLDVLSDVIRRWVRETA